MEELLSKRKIKLVVSDFHLGAGHRNPDGSINILEDFFHDREFIEFLQYYSSGEYDSAEVELVINGDFFNLLMIDYDEPEADIVSEMVAFRRMKRILLGHKACIRALKHFQSLSQKSISFIMGNHDPCFVFVSVQKLLREEIGAEIKFFLDSYEFDGIYIEHGNQYEKANAFDRSNYLMSNELPQPILKQPWGSYFLIHVVNEAKRDRRHFDKILPFGRMLRLIFVTDFRFFFRVIKKILGFFLSLSRRNDPRRPISFKQTLQILLEAPVFPDLDQAAERILATRDEIRTVIFGHNHRPTFRKFGEKKEYINTGTWNEMTHLEIDRFGSHLSCTFALIEYEEKIIKTSLKRWCGNPKLCEEIDVA